MIELTPSLAYCLITLATFEQSQELSKMFRDKLARLAHASTRFYSSSRYETNRAWKNVTSDITHALAGFGSGYSAVEMYFNGHLTLDGLIGGDKIDEVEDDEVPLCGPGG